MPDTLNGLTSTSRGTVLLLGVCMIVLSAALVYHASAMRYEVTHLNPVSIVRTDRLTGRSDLCIEHRMEGTLTCRAAERGETAAEPVPARP
jgi:hypothetical protein